MSLEEQILNMEEQAAAVVAKARAEAKQILDTLEEKKGQIRREFAARLEQDKARIREEYAGLQRDEVAQIQSASQHALKEVEAAQVAKSSRIAQTFLKELLGA